MAQDLNPRQVSRQDHLVWCKNRALEYVEMGDIAQAWASMASDLHKHPETDWHPALDLGTMLIVGGHLSSQEEMRKFIEGFN